MSRIRKALALGLTASAFVVAIASPAGADTIRFSESGQPLVSGYLRGEEIHGVLHCQAAADFLGLGSGGSAPGVVGINPTGTFLGAPKGGTCEAIYEIGG